MKTKTKKEIQIERDRQDAFKAGYQMGLKDCCSHCSCGKCQQNALITRMNRYYD